MTDFRKRLTQVLGTKSVFLEELVTLHEELVEKERRRLLRVSAEVLKELRVKPLPEDWKDSEIEIFHWGAESYDLLLRGMILKGNSLRKKDDKEE